MTYTNDLPSNLLLAETVQRLSQLGCAITADSNRAHNRERNTRNSEASNRARRSGAHPIALAYGKAASL